MKAPLSIVGIASMLGMAVMFACGTSDAESVTEQKTWQQTYAVSSPAPRLYVRNIWGNVKVRAGTTREIAVTVDERRSAPTAALLEESKAHIRLAVEAHGDGVSMIVDNPNDFDERTDLCRGCRAEYQFEIAVPPGTQIDVGTVTDGRVDVSGVHGLVKASNVNGPVAVRDVNDCSNIESVNGSLDVVFARAPGENCNLKTINGEIRVGLPANTGLDAILSVTHGSIESDFDVEPIALPSKLDRREEDRRHIYRFERPVGARVGAGGPTFTFASLNGDVRIFKNK